MYVEMKPIGSAWPIAVDFGPRNHTIKRLSYGVTEAGLIIYLGPNFLPNYSYDPELRFGQDVPPNPYGPTPGEMAAILRQLEKDAADDVSEPEAAPAPRPPGLPLTHRELEEIASLRGAIARTEALWHLSDRDTGADKALTVQERRAAQDARRDVARKRARISRLQGFEER